MIISGAHGEIHGLFLYNALSQLKGLEKQCDRAIIKKDMRNNRMKTTHIRRKHSFSQHL